MNRSFKKNERLSHSADVISVSRSRLGIRGEQLTLKWKPRKQIEGAKPCSRFAVVASKKAVKTAVNRNRMKRLLREFFRVHKENFLFKADVVIIVNRETNATYKEMEMVLTPIFKRAGLLK